eukprot:SM000072S21213  [mRNA]  locus=s72:364201:367847:- [translate_table: standard]
MDVERIEAEGLAPLEGLLRTIDGGATSRPALLALLHKKVAAGSLFGPGFFGRPQPLFSISDGPDSKRSSWSILQLNADGLGLPDRDYYFADEKASIREQYAAHLEKIFRLLGDDEDAAKENATGVFAFETELARNHLTKVERRDQDRVYNKRTPSELAELSPKFNFAAYFREHGIDPPELNVEQPAYISAMGEAVSELSDATWRAYLRWFLVRGTSELLPDEFVQADFEFYGRVLTGQPEIKPRWKRTLAVLDKALGEAVGEMYVQKVFPPEAKSRAMAIVDSVTDALRERLQELPWMTEETKRRALEKLSTFRVKIGYPDKFIDYTDLQVRGLSYVEMGMAGSSFHLARCLARIDRPVDRSRWLMTPQTVNAYYHPKLNEIVFPAAILQFPFFDPTSDDAVNYGAMGTVVGHEMTHGYDDQGRKFDAEGNLQDWWQPEDADEFKGRAQVIKDQFSAYIVHGHNVNGDLTQGENIADLGGVKLAFAAFQKSRKANGTMEVSAPANGKEAEAAEDRSFTPEQRFFLSVAQIWRCNTREAEALRRLTIDPHAPPPLRCNGPLSNIDDFLTAFDIKEGDPMYRSGDLRVDIW